MSVIIFTIIIIIILIASIPLMKRIERHKFNYALNVLQNGMEVDATVTKITSTYDKDVRQRRYIMYAKFVGEDGNEHEARILNVSCLSPMNSGSVIKVKYLPREYDLCFFISKPDDERNN